jgi:hypothetical protein
MLKFSFLLCVGDCGGSAGNFYSGIVRNDFFFIEALAVHSYVNVNAIIVQVSSCVCDNCVCGL